MENQIKAIVENGILGLLEEYKDLYGELDNETNYIFETLFEDKNFKLSQNGKNVFKVLEESISRGCTREEISIAYKSVTHKETGLNGNFYNIFPKMFADILLRKKALKIESKTLTKEEQVGCKVLEFLGVENLGLDFFKMTKERMNDRTEDYSQIDL